MNNTAQPSAEIISHIKKIPIYQDSVKNGVFPILEKPKIAENFPDNWMTSELSDALANGNAEMVLSTGTNHARMQIIRPPLFLLHSYYKLWSDHPDISFTWEQGCQRASLTTVLATEHVKRVNKNKKKSHTDIDSRRLDERTLYINESLDPALWNYSSIQKMLKDIQTIKESHSQGLYHLDCSSYHLVHFLIKLKEFKLEKKFPEPASIIHAYEYTPKNVKKFLNEKFKCPIIDLFGSTELGYLYYSNKNNEFHSYLDKMQIELIPFAPENSIFSLIVSSIRNPYMPLVRYRSGDCVQTTDGTDDPDKIKRICGREKEMLVTPKGIFSQADFDDLISQASDNFFVYQLKAETPETLKLIYITFNGEPVSADIIEKLKHTVQSVTGMSLSVTYNLFISIGKSGKYAWISQ